MHWLSLHKNTLTHRTIDQIRKHPKKDIKIGKHKTSNKTKTPKITTKNQQRNNTKTEKQKTNKKSIEHTSDFTTQTKKNKKKKKTQKQNRD